VIMTGPTTLTFEGAFDTDLLTRAESHA
jgi:hypothetical protein